VNQTDPTGRSVFEDLIAIGVGGTSVGAGLTVSAACFIGLGDSIEQYHCLGTGASLTVGGALLIDIGLSGDA
jgi:hypothetical protein